MGGMPSRAVDGNTSGNWGDGSVTHTAQEYRPWWQVDLGAVASLQTVRLWNRADCCAERLSNFYVLVSDVAFTSTDLTAPLNQAGVSSYHVAGPVGANTTVTVNRSGRYVRVQLAGTNYLSLAEVEVVGTATGGSSGGAQLQWLMADWRGTPRMVVGQGGRLSDVARHDYLPFGEEVYDNVGNGSVRSATLGYGVSSNDGVRQKFVGYERDNETGLDFVQARYFGSTMGRFTSPDPVLVSVRRMVNPQIWNGYS